MRTKIKYLLIDKRLTVKELADLLGYTPSYISYIINGRSDGSQEFWDKFKNKLNIPDNEIEYYRNKY